MVVLTVVALVVSVLFISYQHWSGRWPLRWTKSGPVSKTRGRKSPMTDRTPDLRQQSSNMEHDSSDDDGSASTPKAQPRANGDLPSVPTFTLGTPDGVDESRPAAEDHTKSTPATTLTSTSMASGTSLQDTITNASASGAALNGHVPKPSPNRMPAPTSAGRATPSASSLMPPPAVRPSALRPLPRTAGSLQPPPSAAALQRGPPPGAAAGSRTATLSASTLPPGQRPSRKVVLAPGHSPLDWAALTRAPPTPSFLRGADVPQGLIKVPPSALKVRNGRRGRDAWGTWQGRVYNLTPYLPFHPGGAGELLRGAGKPGAAERLFNEVHPWVNWDNMLGECLVGILVSEPEAAAPDSMDGVD